MLYDVKIFLVKNRLYHLTKLKSLISKVLDVLSVQNKRASGDVP